MEYLFLVYLGFALLFYVAWRVAEARQNATMVDIIWALCIAFGGGIHALQLGGDLSREVFVLFAISYWAFRLAWHLYRDRLRGRPEDSRYRSLREKWGSQARQNFWFVFQIQALLSFCLSTVLIPAFANTKPFGDFWDGFGIALWIFAVAGESLSDHQLKQFKLNPANRGKTCQEGLWRYSRHPNYFFEWLHWFAYVAWAAGSEMEWLAWMGPVIMLWFLVKVTGIPASEAQSLKSRGEEYREYQRRTSAFIPWFRKR